MKRFAFLALTSIILLSLFVGNNNVLGQDYKNKLIRFHVIANSDSKQDQGVKLKVRDEVLKYIGPKIKNAKTKDEAIEIINENLSQIEYISNKTLKNNHFNYTATVALKQDIFPIKSYGSITLEEGEYTALKIVLGEGEGKNWWCVMFPPLCFIDITKGLTTDTTQKELKKVLNQQDLYKISNNAKIGQQNVVFKFKIVEIIKNVIK